MLEEEINLINENIGGYLEMEGFISTSLNQVKAAGFSFNTLMVIQVPMKNLNGILDNGFARVAAFSAHPSEE